MPEWDTLSELVMFPFVSSVRMEGRRKGTFGADFGVHVINMFICFLILRGIVLHDV